MEKTQYYQLQQQGPADGMSHDVLNENLTKIDTAIHTVKTAGDGNLSTMRSELASARSSLSAATAAKCQICTGKYHGDNTSERTISLPFTPVAVLVETNKGMRGSDDKWAYGGLALEGAPLRSDTIAAVLIVNRGFKVTDDIYRNTHLNLSTNDYHYIAFR